MVTVIGVVVGAGARVLLREKFPTKSVKTASVLISAIALGALVAGFAMGFKESYDEFLGQ